MPKKGQKYWDRVADALVDLSHNVRNGEAKWVSVLWTGKDRLEVAVGARPLPPEVERALREKVPGV